MTKKFTRKRFIVFPTIAVLALTGLSVPANADARLTLQGDEPLADVVEPDVLKNLPSSVQDALVVTVDPDPAEDVITAVTAEGEPVQVVVQREPIDDKFQPELSYPAGYDPEAYTTEAPGPQSSILQTEPMSTDVEWQLSAVTVTESNAVTLYWPEAGEFDLGIEDSAVTSDAVEASPADQTESSGSSSTVQIDGLESGSTYTLTATASDTNEVRYIEVRTFDDGAKASDQLLQPLAYQPYYQSYIHKTFIPDNRIDVGLRCPDQNGYTFGGDNRGYRVPALNEPYATPDYRTMMFVHINWDNPAPYDLMWSKNVGQTRVYNSSGGLYDAAYTSMDGMQAGNGSSTSSFATMSLTHAANDPLCTVFWGGVNHAPPIWYSEKISFYRSGSTKVEGNRHKAPAHEMYAKFTNSTGSSEYWNVITRRPNVGFECLIVALCGSDSYNLTRSS